MFRDIYGAENSFSDTGSAMFDIRTADNNGFRSEEVSRRELGSMKVNFPDLVNGNGSWKNISSIVRFCFREVIERLDKVEKQNEVLSLEVERLRLGNSQQTTEEKINSLERKYKHQQEKLEYLSQSSEKAKLQLESKADQSYVTDCLLTKANKSDITEIEQQYLSKNHSTNVATSKLLQDQVIEQTIRIDGKVDQLKGQLEEVTDVQSQMQNVMTSIQNKLSKYALVTEVNNCLEAKANKVAVANALHRKANKNEISSAIEILEKKLEKNSNSSLRNVTFASAELDSNNFATNQKMEQNQLTEHFQSKLFELQSNQMKLFASFDSSPSAESISIAMEKLQGSTKEQINRIRENVARKLSTLQTQVRLEMENKLLTLKESIRNDIKPDEQQVNKASEIFDGFQFKIKEIINEQIEELIHNKESMDPSLELRNTLSNVRSAVKTALNAASDLKQVQVRVDNLEEVNARISLKIESLEKQLSLPGSEPTMCDNVDSGNLLRDSDSLSSQSSVDFLTLFKKSARVNGNFYFSGNTVDPEGHSRLEQTTSNSTQNEKKNVAGKKKKIKKKVVVKKSSKKLSRK